MFTSAVQTCANTILSSTDIYNECWLFVLYFFSGEPIRVTGKVVGNVNGVTLTDADLHSYVLTSEGRSYTALSRVPSQIGYDLQSITAIGTGIAWLFATPVNNVKNGFSTTGEYWEYFNY